MRSWRSPRRSSALTLRLCVGLAHGSSPFGVRCSSLCLGGSPSRTCWEQGLRRRHLLRPSWKITSKFYVYASWGHKSHPTPGDYSPRGRECASRAPPHSSRKTLAPSGLVELLHLLQKATEMGGEGSPPHQWLKRTRRTSASGCSGLSVLLRPPAPSEALSG